MQRLFNNNKSMPSTATIQSRELRLYLAFLKSSTRSKSTCHPSFLFDISRRAISIQGGPPFLRLQSAFRGLSNLGGTVGCMLRRRSIRDRLHAIVSSNLSS